MNDTLGMKIIQRKSHLTNVKPYDVLFEVTHPIEMKAKVATQHEIENHEEVFVILERITQIAYEG